MTTQEIHPRLATDVVAAVREATAAAPRRATGQGFSLNSASVAERMLAPFLGLYLGYAVVRLPEVFPEMAVLHLPMILMLGFIVALVASVPAPAWRLFWERSRALRLVAILGALSVITIPLGMWPAGSLDLVQTRYVVCVTIFVCCLVFMRDRRTMRIAISIYVLSVGAVSYDVLKTYDPNAPVYDEYGSVYDPDYVTADMRRLKAVGTLDPNDFGAVICTAFPLALWLSVGSLKRRIFWSGIAVLLVAAVVPTQSRGAELGMVAATAVILSIGARGWQRWLSFVLVAGCIALFLMLATGFGAGSRLSDFSADDYNVSGNSGRMYFWKQGMVWMIKRPWGYGVDNFPVFFGIMNDGLERAAHSTWVQYGMELGVAGLATFVMICVTLIKGLRKLRVAARAWIGRHPGAKEEEILAGHTLALLAGVLGASTFLSNAYTPLLYMSLGMAGAVLLGSPIPEPVQAKPVEPAGPTLHRRRLRSFPGAAAAG